MRGQTIETERAAGEPPAEMSAPGFSLVEALVALAVLTVTLLGVARLAAEGVRLGAEATRLNRSLEVLDDTIATAPAGATVRGCDVDVEAVSGAIAWRWVEARCTRVEAAVVSGGGRSDLAAGDRAVGRRVLVPW